MCETALISTVGWTVCPSANPFRLFPENLDPGPSQVCHESLLLSLKTLQGQSVRSVTGAEFHQPGTKPARLHYGRRFVID